jgi:WD40 repeat protein
LAQILSGHQERAHALDVSPDGTLIATGGLDKSVRIWDIKQGKEIHKFEGHDAEVYWVAFSPDGKRVASCGKDEHVLLWGLGK